jgi:phosphomannomutase
MPSDQGKLRVDRLRRDPPASLGGMKITSVDDLDGLKLLFGDEGWILFRASGTEPVLRVYSEAPTQAVLDAVMSESLALIS